MTDKLIRVSLQTWQKLRTIAFNQNKYMKTVLEDIVSGKLGPIKREVK
jgi:hypothetical protein